MKKYSEFILAVTLCLFFSSNSQSATYNIVDYPGFNVGSINKGNPTDTPDTLCPSAYNKTSCPDGFKLNDPCTDKNGTKYKECSGCAIPTSPWSYTKPSVATTRLKIKDGECGKLYAACSEGYLPTAYSYSGTNLTSCPNGSMVIGGGEYCAKCPLDEVPSYCTKVTTSANLIPCVVTTSRSERTYNGENYVCCEPKTCPSGQALNSLGVCEASCANGFYSSGSICVPCTTMACTNGCARYEECGGTQVCRECKSSVVCPLPIACLYGCKTSTVCDGSTICTECHNIGDPLKMSISISNRCPTGLSYQGVATYIAYGGSSETMDISDGGEHCYDSGEGTTAYGYDYILSTGASITLNNLNYNFTSIKSLFSGKTVNVNNGSVTYTMNMNAPAVMSSTGYDYWTLQCEGNAMECSDHGDCYNDTYTHLGYSYAKYCQTGRCMNCYWGEYYATHPDEWGPNGAGCTQCHGIIKSNTTCDMTTPFCEYDSDCVWPQNDSSSDPIYGADLIHKCVSGTCRLMAMGAECSNSNPCSNGLACIAGNCDSITLRTCNQGTTLSLFPTSGGIPVGTGRCVPN